MVNYSGISIDAGEIVNFLKQEIRFKDICQEIIHRHIVERAAQERGVSVTPEEIQVEANRFRHVMRLEKASDTLAWLAEQAIEADDWELGIYHKLLADKLAKSLFARDVDKHFAQNKLDFEKVNLYKITVPYEKLAQELVYQIEEEEVCFYEAAHIYNAEEEFRLKCGHLGKLDRWSLKSDVEVVVFAAEPKQVLGPFKAEQGYDLLMVEEFISAELNEETRDRIVKEMFKEWLAGELNHVLHGFANSYSS
jgi:parvulin-like peptidyl-prolyl isomerase